MEIRNVIAVVDDDPDMREALAELLSAYDYLTEEFASGAEFLDAAVTSRATCLVVDIQLGEISGVDLVRRLCATGFKFPVIFVTGSQDCTIRRQARAVGCGAYLNTPFLVDHLLEAIGKATGSSPELER
jgi:FixJ family two-component response regulator